MKVVLKTTVLDRILEDITKAERENRLVDYVLVTPDEYAKLRHDTRAERAIYSVFPDYPGSATSDPFATIKTWDFEYQGTNPARYQRRIRVVSNLTIYGYPLLEVPAEYHPK